MSRSAATPPAPGFAPAFAAVYLRELRALFLSPPAWVVIAAFALAAGALAHSPGGFFAAGRADLAGFFAFHPWLHLVFLPALGMRLWAEDARSGAIDLVFSLPAPLAALVTARFAAAWTAAGLALALTAPMWVAVNWLGEPDNAAIALGYAMSFLLAGAYLALASAFSALADSQVTAFVLAVAAGFLATAAGLPLVASAVAAVAGPGVAEAVASLSFLRHFEAAQRGVLEARAVVFYLLAIGLGLSLTGVWAAGRRG